MDRARQLGVNTPIVYNYDHEDRKIKMQDLKDYEPAKYFIERQSSSLESGKLVFISEETPGSSWTGYWKTTCR